MVPIPFRLAAALIEDPTRRAVTAGLAIGAVAATIAARRPGDLFAFAMAIVLVLSASASFVLHALATTRRRAGEDTAAQAARWIAPLGGGILIALHAVGLVWS